jgi:hypothetical protein
VVMESEYSLSTEKCLSLTIININHRVNKQNGIK